MAITQAVANQFKSDLWIGLHLWGTDAFKMALFVAAATLDATTTAYATTNEVTGTGYTAGGTAITAVAPVISGATAYINISPNPSWTTATFTARGTMLYNTSRTNKMLAVWDFGGDFTVTAGTFTLTMPAAAAATAILRIA